MFMHDGNSIPNAPAKDPDSTIDYGCDWSGWLQTAETVTASAWTVAGLTTSSEVNTGIITGVMLAGGTAGEFYILTNRITTNFGRVVDRSMTIECREQ